MGLIRAILGGGAAELTRTVGQVADGFRPNATRDRQLTHEAYVAALDQHGTEFQHGRPGLFDAVVNGLNRLPRPMLALGTLSLFIYAMLDPAGFAPRMQGLALVPDPLWWLLGAIVSFYFGARELHYARSPRKSARVDLPSVPSARETLPSGKPSTNAALEAWRARRGG
ncbi:MAG: holin family protein [Pseudomonadota bacterium]